MRVLLDGRPIADNLAGTDAHNGVVTASAQRLYNLVDLPKVEHRTLRLVPEPGVMGCALTFG
jgi:Thioredoxin like C-terminal domain